MRIIARLLQLACPVAPGFSITISNPPWQDLVIRDTQQRGPHRLPTISVAHCCERDGEIVQAPEMLFEVEQAKKRLILTPYCFRDQAAKIEQASVYLEHGSIRVNYSLQAEHMTFVRSWNACLEQQGFIAAFQRLQFIGQLRRALDAEVATGCSIPPEQLKQIFDRALSNAVGNHAPAVQP